jgi:hypothetical protein
MRATVSADPAEGSTVAVRDNDPIESMISNPNVRAVVVPCPAFAMLCFRVMMVPCSDVGK